MKKFLLPILLIMMFVPFKVNAKEYCKVVSGNGKDIGSEIACGTEHFYTVDSNEDEIKMLAKYNLYTGISIEKIKIEKVEGDTREDYQYCNDLASSMNGYIKKDDFYSSPGYCFIAKLAEREDKRILQSEDAKSAHWDEELNYLYPQVGDVYIRDYHNSYYYPEIIERQIENTNFYDYSLDLSSYNDASELFTYNNTNNPQGVNGPLYFYKRELEKTGYTISDVSMLSLSELNSIIETISGQSLPFQTWNTNVQVTNGLGTSASYGYLAEFGSLKEYVPNNYSWLYSTTYWNRSIYTSDTTYSGRYYVFTAQQGKICGAGFLMCAPETTLGCGVRPTITIPTNEIQYLVNTKTDGNGTIEVVDNALGNDTIQFKTTSKKGYKLKSIVVTTDSGEKIEFSEGEIIKNPDGTESVDKNKFTMPFENVTIEAKWIEDFVNPKTGDNLLIIVLSMMTSLGIGTFIYKKKESRYKI